MIRPFRDAEDSILMTVLAERTGCHLSTVHRWRQSGQLECVRVGGRWTVSRDAWDRFLERCNPPEEPTQPVPVDWRTNKTTKQRERELARDEERAVALGL